MDIKLKNELGERIKGLGNRLHQGWHVWMEKIRAMEEENRILKEKLALRMEGTVEIWRRRSDEMEAAWTTEATKAQQLEKRVEDNEKSWIKRMEAKEEEVNFLKTEIAKLEEHVCNIKKEAEVEGDSIKEENLNKISQLEKTLQDERTAWAQTIRSIKAHLMRREQREQTDREKEKEEFEAFKNTELEKVEKERKQLVDREQDWHVVIQSMKRRMVRQEDRHKLLVEKKEKETQDLSSVLSKKKAEYDMLEKRFIQETEQLRAEMGELIDRNREDRERERADWENKVREMEEYNRELRTQVVERDKKMESAGREMSEMKKYMAEESGKTARIRREKEEWENRMHMLEEEYARQEEKFSQEREEWEKKWRQKEKELRKEIESRVQEVMKLEEKGIENEDKAKNLIGMLAREKERLERDFLRAEKVAGDVHAQHLHEIKGLKDSIDHLKKTDQERIQKETREIESRAVQEIEELKSRLADEVNSMKTGWNQERLLWETRVNELKAEMKDMGSAAENNRKRLQEALSAKEQEILALKNQYIGETGEQQKKFEQERKMWIEDMKGLEQGLLRERDKRKEDKEKALEEAQALAAREIDMLKARLVDEVHNMKESWAQERVVWETQVNDLKAELEERERLIAEHDRQRQQDMEKKQSEITGLKEKYLQDMKVQEQKHEDERKTWAENMRKLERVIKERHRR